MFGNFVFYFVIVLVLAIFLTAAIAGFSAAPYVPTFTRDVKRLLELAGVTKDELVVDLGAGDGRFLIAAIRYGARAIGYEISLLLYCIAQATITLRRLRGKIRIVYKNFYDCNLGNADVICCFLTPKAMKRLEPKFERECKRGARVVSYAFKLPQRKPSMVSKPTQTSTPIFLYVY